MTFISIGNPNYDRNVGTSRHYQNGADRYVERILEYYDRRYEHYVQVLTHISVALAWTKDWSLEKTRKAW